MVNFKERLAKKNLERPIDPIKIYNSLDRITSKGELRPAQSVVLENWYKNYRDKKDTIIKLSTGKGKTLIGLLILQSKINNGEGPCLYLCPNKYLVQQTCEEAKSFGIDVCTTDGELPIEFENGQKILVTTVKKLFNGKSYFGINNTSISVGTIIFDDSHACLDEIQSAFTIKISRHNNERVFGTLFELFADNLKNQGQGTFEELKLGTCGTYIPVPYWNWIDNIGKVTELLTRHAKDNFLIFQWPLLKDDLKNCSCIFSNEYIEISPYRFPVEKFGSFFNAHNRIYMSATINNDSFFIKHLNMDEEAIKNPLKLDNETWSGEKMILIPSLVDDKLDTDKIMEIFARKQDPSKKKRYFGTCILTSSFKSAMPWGKNGAIVSDGNDIDKLIKRLKEENFESPIVFANRYDGLDLPDSTCRILIFDGMPYSENLIDKYYEECIGDTSVTITKLAQKIEQGLGRNVRGDKDYGAILILGKDLIRFLMADKYKKYFSEQTQKQIEIGLNVVKFLKEELETEDGSANSVTVLIGVLKQLLNRDDGWKSYYVEEMDKVALNNKNKILTELSVQQKAELANYKNKYQEAAEIIQEFLNKNMSNLSDNEYGWYTQQIARYKYPYSKSQSQNAQKIAYNKNSYLLKPDGDIEVKRLKSDNIIQSNNIKKYLETLLNENDFNLEANDIVDSLKFGVSSEKFEKGIYRLGKMLGFASERPDKQYKAGPDNLWAVAPNEYFVIECKNEVKENRNCITQSETGQMNNTYNWFSKKYQGTNPTYIMIIPTSNIDSRGGFNCDVHIIKERGLKKLRDNIVSFASDIISSGFKTLNEKEIMKMLELHKLNYKSFATVYFDKPQDIILQKEIGG